MFLAATGLPADLDRRPGDDRRARKLALHPGCAGCLLCFGPSETAGDLARRAPVSYNDSAALFARGDGDGGGGGAHRAMRFGRGAGLRGPDA